MRDVVVAEWVEDPVGSPQLQVQVFVTASPAGEGRLIFILTLAGIPVRLVEM